MRSIMWVVAVSLVSCSGSKKDEPTPTPKGPADAAIRAPGAESPVFPAMTITADGAEVISVRTNGQVLVGDKVAGVLRGDLRLVRPGGGVLAQLDREHGIKLPAWKHGVTVSAHGQIERDGQPPMRFGENGMLAPGSPRPPVVRVKGAKTAEDRRIAAFVTALTLVRPSEKATAALVRAPGLSKLLTLRPLFAVVPAKVSSSVTKNLAQAWAPIVARDSQCKARAGSKKGASILLELAAPTVVTKLVIGLGPLDEDEPDLLDGFVYPSELKVAVDGGAATVLKAGDEPGFELDLGGKPVTKIEIVTAALSGKSGKPGCISDISIVGRSAPYTLVALKQTAVDQLRKQLPAIIRASNSCDKTALSRWVRFPFAWEIARDHDNPARSQTFKNIKELLQMCNRGNDDTRGIGAQVQDRGAATRADYTSSPNGVSLSNRIGTISWDFVWSKKGWKLTRLTAADLKKD